MGHLPIVSESSLTLMIKKGAVLVMVPRADCRPSQKWADILADALCIRKGDPVFPWVVKSKQTGFSYQFKASDSAYLVDEPGYHIGSVRRTLPKAQRWISSLIVPATASCGTRSARNHLGVDARSLTRLPTRTGL